MIKHFFNECEVNVNNLLVDTVNSLLNGDSNLVDEHSNICPICGFNNTVDTAFCSECGEKLPELKIEAMVTKSPSEEVKNSDAEETDATLQKVNVSDGCNVANSGSDNENAFTLTCPFCGTANESEARFCGECGHELANSDESLKQNIFLENAVGDLLGGSNNGEEETSTQAVPDIMVKAADMRSEKPIETGIQEVTANVAENTVNENILPVTCQFCGTANESEARFCGECGQELSNSDKSVPQNSFLENVVGDLLGSSNNEFEETPTPAVSDITVKANNMPDEKPTETGIQAVPANVAENTANENILPLICPFCGTDNRSIARFCRECGRKFNKAAEGVALDDVLDDIVGDLMGGVSEKNENIAQPIIANNTEEIKEVPIATQNETESAFTVSENDSFAQNNFLDKTVDELLGGSFDKTTASTTEVNSEYTNDMETRRIENEHRN